MGCVWSTNPTASVFVSFVLLGFDGGRLRARAEGWARWVECGVSQETNREQLGPYMASRACGVSGSRWRGRRGWSGMTCVSGAAQRLAASAQALLLSARSPEAARLPLPGISGAL